MELARITARVVEISEGLKVWSSEEECHRILRMVRDRGGDGIVAVDERGSWSIYISKSPRKHEKGENYNG